jgi:hypothetical protein
MTTVISSKDETLKPGRSARRRASKAEAPAEDDIRILAYDLFEQRQADGEQGDAVSDWIEAERRLSGIADA